MGVDQLTIQQFVRHPWYTPSTQTEVVEALNTLEKTANQAEFIKVAITADDGDEAFFFTRMAVLLAIYNDNFHAVQEIIVPNGLAIAYTEKNELMIPLNLDYAIWSPRAEQFLDAIKKSQPTDRPIDGRILWISGTVSERVKQEITARGWELRDHLEDYWLKLYDDKMQAPGEADPTRILPEIGT